ncbi:D-alanyl-D-alanine carboxypeptidase family protein [Chelativorans sp. AA-79]|uniref:D-alanyl-D-alanine carboxypeptidase family protein n=1 Tax=Chelativorans sp. AA-79 TaxID=3028735 RepID=UPI0023F737A1|nr:D-alanyl-D-alanine carboxypeptidase family protein [Chelativorans sp. AA-79]WEX10087.1 D-alanyl-D-alanine carboxypeptidase [Chelativorans sp. AA-79]
MRHWRHKPIILAATLFALLLGLPAHAGPFVLLDVGSGRVLAHEDAFQRWYPASLTKLMTAYVVFRALESGAVQLNSPVRITQNAAKEPPSKIGYPQGSVLTLDNALKIFLVMSANDVTTAVAESVGGSEEAFVARMNGEARRLGMTDTRFINAHGLPGPSQYTTARDLAILVRALRTEFPRYAGYFSIEGVRNGESVKENTNFLIGRFDGADGMKTGYICSSGFNLVATATRGRRTLAAIVLGAHSQVERAELAAELLARGFKAPGLGGPNIASLRPSGQTTAAVADIRGEICTQEAVEQRMKERDDQGRFVLTSPHVHPMQREPRVVAVGLGGAMGEEPAKPRYADVPIPTPRPDYTPQPVAVQQGG